MALLLLRCVVLQCMFSLALGAIWSGVIRKPAAEPYAFVGKFVFSEDQVKRNDNFTVEFWVDYEIPDSADLKLISLYGHQWKDLYALRETNDLTCKKMIDAVENQKITTLYKKDWKEIDGHNRVVAHHTIAEHYQRTWYFFLLNCNEQGENMGISKMNYKAHFLNNNYGSWSRELGADEHGLNSYFLCFFFLMGTITGIHCYGTKLLKQKMQYLHPMVKLLFVSVFCQFAVILFAMVHWVSYSSNGRGVPFAIQLAYVLEGVSRCFLMLLLFLFAKGWTINLTELRAKKAIVSILTSFMLLHIVFQIYIFVIEDPADPFVSKTAEALLWLEVIAWMLAAVYFTFTVFKSYGDEENPVKKNLFRNLAFFFVPWFVVYPVAQIFVLSGHIDGNLQRPLSLPFINVTTSVMGIAYLGYLMWPSRADSFFDIAKPDVMLNNIDTYEQL